MKPWYQSKTFWAGIGTVLISIIQYLQQQDWSDLENVNWVGVVAGGMMIVLRWLTDKPITSNFAKIDNLRPKIMKRVNGKGAQK